MRRSYIIFIILLVIIGAFTIGCSNDDVTQGGSVFSLRYFAGSGGQIEGVAEQTIEFGGNGSAVIAVPDEGYRFVKWLDNNSTVPERSDLYVENDINATALFEKYTYTIEYLVDEGGYIVGDQTQTVEYGEYTTSVTAMPHDGYKFIGWSDDGTIGASRRDNVLWGFRIIAHFEFLFDSGNGTANDPFKINSYEQLLNIKYYPQSHYILIGNLDLSDINHNSIFDNNISFLGEFNGGGHFITNLNINNNSAFPSLFGYIGRGGIVKNLNISGVNISVPNYNATPLRVGTVAGVSLGLLSNISVEGKILCDKPDYSGVAIGGLVGQSKWTIEDCSVEIDIELHDFTAQSGELNIGGLVGVTDGNIIGCETTGSILLEKNDDVDVDITDEITIGGIAGVICASSSSVAYVKITESTANVAINSGYYSNIGGLLGVVSSCNLIIDDCIATGNIVCASGSAAGFINDCNSGSETTIRNCFATGNTTCSNGNAFGFMKRAGGNISYCYATGNVVGNSYAAGFIDHLTGNVCKSYSSGSVTTSHIAAGFIIMGSGEIEECFSVSDVVSTCSGGLESAQVSGFVLALGGGQIKNCYATGDVKVLNDHSDIAIAAVGIAVSGSIVNCYYSGKISLTETSSSGNRIGALTWGAGMTQDIINCHWLCHSDSVVDYPYNADRSNRPNLITETYMYEKIEDMCTQEFVDMLNFDSESTVWIKIENSTPQLAFMLQE